MSESRDAEAWADAYVEPEVDFEEPLAVTESPTEVMARVWGQSVPWRERVVDPGDGHRHSNVEGWPGSPAYPFTWPLVGRRRN